MEKTIPLHSIAMYRDLTCPVPSRVSSASLNVTVLVPAICPHYCSRSLVIIPSRTWDSFKIFSSVSGCISKDNSKDSVEICASCFVNCSTAEYSHLLRVLVNSAMSSSLTHLFLAVLLPMPPSLSLSFSASVRSFNLYTLAILVTPPISETYRLHFPIWLKLVSQLVRVQRRWWVKP